MEILLSDCHHKKSSIVILTVMVARVDMSIRFSNLEETKDLYSMSAWNTMPNKTSAMLIILKPISVDWIMMFIELMISALLQVKSISNAKL